MESSEKIIRELQTRLQTLTLPAHRGSWHRRAQWPHHDPREPWRGGGGGQWHRRHRPHRWENVHCWNMGCKNENVDETFEIWTESVFSVTEESKEADAFGNFLIERKEVVQVRNRKCAMPEGSWPLQSTSSCQEEKTEAEWRRGRKLETSHRFPSVGSDYHLECVLQNFSGFFNQGCCLIRNLNSWSWTSCLIRWPLTVWPLCFSKSYWLLFTVSSSLKGKIYIFI